MAEVARLTARLTADTADFEKGLNKAWKKLDRFTADYQSLIKKGAVAATAAATGLAFLAARQADVIGKMADMSKSIGITVREFQALKLVAGEAGVDAQGLVGAVGKLQKTLIDAAQGSKEAQRAFSVLGVSFNDILKLEPQQQFEAVAQALSKVQNPAERTALAMDIFGKAGRDLLPVIEDFSTKLQEARDFNDRFNISLSEIDTRNIDRAGDTVGRVKEAFGGFLNTVAIQFAPVVESIGESLLSAGVDGQDFGRAVKTGMSVAAVAVDQVRASINGLKIVFAQAISGIADLGANAIDKIYGATDALSALIFSVEGEKVKQFKDGLLESGLALRKMSDDAAESATVMEDAANKMVLAQDYIDSAQLKSRQKSKEEIKNSPKTIPENLIGGFSSDKKKSDLFAETLESLRAESAELGLQISMFGKKSTAVDKAIKMMQLENKFKKENIILSETQRGQLSDYLTKIEEQNDAYAQMESWNNIIKGGIDDIADAFANGGKMADVFKRVAINAIGQVVKTAFANMGSGGSGGGGGILGGLFSSGISGFFGNLFGGLFGGGMTGAGAHSLGGKVPSYDVGTNFVPRDMLANIHKGEMIIPAREAAALRAGGSGATIVQNISIGAGVSTAVRAEVIKMLPELKKATVAGVEDAKLRGAIS